MTTHDLKIRERWAARVRSGEKRAEIRKHDRDFQVGDTVRLIPVSEYGNVLREFVERDARGRFVNEWRTLAPIEARITHVLDGRQAAGIEDGYCLLSIEVTA